MSKTGSVQESVQPQHLSVHVSKGDKEAAKSKLHEFIKEETRMVKGIFQNYETPGAGATITVMKYPGVQPFKKEMMDGCEYEIPLYVARFLNGVDVTAGALSGNARKNEIIGTCSYGVHGFKTESRDANDLRPSSPNGMSEAGSGIPVPLVGIAKRVRRYGFQSLEFGRKVE